VDVPAGDRLAIKLGRPGRVVCLRLSKVLPPERIDSIPGENDLLVIVLIDKQLDFNDDKVVIQLHLDR